MLQGAQVQGSQGEPVEDPTDASGGLVQGQVGGFGEDLGLAPDSGEVMDDVGAAFLLTEGRQLVAQEDALVEVSEGGGVAGERPSGDGRS